MLTDNNYIRDSDGTFMLEAEPGWFVSSRVSNTPQAVSRNALDKPQPEALEALENSMTESPDRISDRYVTAELDRIFRPNDGKAEDDGKDEFVDGKRRVHSKPRCNPTPSRGFRFTLQPFQKLASDNDNWSPVGRRFRECVPMRDCSNASAPGLGDTTQETLRNRAKIERYNVERPAKDNPEHTMYPRESRNASPNRPKDEKQLVAFWDYRELNKSAEPLQSNFLSADNDNNAEYEGCEEGDAKKRSRDVEAELETRPGIEDLERVIGSATVRYETRMVHTSDYPRLIEPGYCLTCGKTEMKFPVSGDVWCVGFHKDKVAEYENSARISLAGTNVKPTRKKIDACVDRMAKPERLNIRDVAKHRAWSICQVGDLKIAPFRTKHHYRGAVIEYRDKNGEWRRIKKDEYGTPYGPNSLITIVSDENRYKKYWASLKPRTTKPHEDMRSPEEKAKQRAKQIADKKKQIQCAPPTDEMIEAFRLQLIANGKPANDNRWPCDGLPYNVKSADELQFGYAFGKTSAAGQDESEPDEDDVVERKQFLAALNTRLSPQTRRVANMVVNTDETHTLAGSYLDVGTALATGRDTPSDRTLMRHGKEAIAAAAAEISQLSHQLAA